jgi:hypothetical protein
MPSVKLRSLFAAVISEALTLKHPIQCAAARWLRSSPVDVHNHPLFGEARASLYIIFFVRLDSLGGRPERGKSLVVWWREKRLIVS